MIIFAELARSRNDLVDVKAVGQEWTGVSLCRARMTRRFSALFCLGVPLAILALAYLWLAIDHGTPLLWNVRVHESGRYTLRETIFYFTHFLREIPIDIGYALFIVAGFARAGSDSSLPVSRRRSALLAKGALGIACALLALAFAGAVLQEGFNSAGHDLLQFRTRDTLSAYGSHWHFHWLSTLWFGVAAMLAAPLIAGFCGGPASGIGKWGHRTWLISWGYFAGMTVLFGFSGETFTDVRYAGHQAREILTHGPVTLLVAFGALHFSARGRSDSFHGLPPEMRAITSRPGVLFQLAFIVAIPLYLAVVALSGDIMQAGQSGGGLAAMVGAHFFEHILDYLLVVLLVIGGYYPWIVQRTEAEKSSR